MVATVQINERGSLTLPKALRKKLGIEKGGVVVVEDGDGGLFLRPAVAYPIEIYSDARVKEFDEGDAALKRHLARKGRS